MLKDQSNRFINYATMAIALPPSPIQRWGRYQKGAVVAAVNAGTISFNEACAKYFLSPEELKNWVDLHWRHGIEGLRTTKLQTYSKFTIPRIAIKKQTLKFKKR